MTKRIMLQLSFYKFLQKLKYKCKQYRVFLSVVPEDLTTQLCSRCGNKKIDIDGAKQYNCNQCNLKIDRDINSCRNIYMMWIN